MRSTVPHVLFVASKLFADPTKKSPAARPHSSMAHDARDAKLAMARVTRVSCRCRRGVPAAGCSKTSSEAGLVAESGSMVLTARCPQKRYSLNWFVESIQDTAKKVLRLGVRFRGLFYSLKQS